MDLSEYTGVEVNPCRREILDGQDVYEVCQPEDPELFCWSVYLRHADGDVTCVADCASTKNAELVAAGLSMLLTHHTKG